jgi:hypothetical protein
MADPVTLAMVGAAAGAALKPKNPLQGAMLGATAGFTGGTALGIGAAGAAGAAGTGLATGGTALGGGLGSAGAANAVGGALGSTGLTAGTGTGIGLGAGTSAALTAPAATTGYALAAPAATSAAMAPTFMESVGMAGKSAYENPMMTAQALNATQGLLTPEQQPPSAPAMPLQTGRGVKPYDPMAALNPYQQSVIGGQPISLI